MPRVRLSGMSRSTRGIAAIVGGTGAGQLILLAAAPITSRLFPPEVFGPFAVVNSLVLPLAAISALRYELAIPIPDRDRDARTIVSLGLRLTALLTILGLIVTVVFGNSICRLFGATPQLFELLFWVPVIAGLMGAFAVLNQFAIRSLLYTAIARRNVLQACGVAVFQVLAGLLHLGAHGLTAGLAMGQAVGVIAMWRSVRPLLAGPRSTVADHKRMARRYRAFPMMMAPSGLVNSLGLQAPVILAASLFGPKVAGWLGMTQRVLLLPVALLGLAVAQVFLGEFSAARRGVSTHNNEQLFLVASKRLLLVGAGAAGLLLVLGRWVFPFVLGHQWATSGVYAQALAVGLAAQMVASPLSQVIIVTGRSRWQAMWDVCRLLLSVGAVYAGYRLLHSDVAAMWLLGGVTTATYVALWAMARMAVRRDSVAGTNGSGPDARIRAGPPANTSRQLSSSHVKNSGRSISPYLAISA